jgi:carboxypeptidase C (cathepsin A)
VFVGQGYFDFATPFFGAEYSLSRTGIPQDRIQYHYYGSGHMMYVRDEDRAQAVAGHKGVHPTSRIPNTVTCPVPGMA